MEDKYIELYEYLQECVDIDVYTENEANAILNIAYDRYITERNAHNKLSKESSDSDDFKNYIFLDVQSNKAKVLNYLKQSSETNKYAQDIVDSYSGEIIIFDGKMIGRIFIGNKKDKGFITDFSIDKEHRGNKLGSRLIDDAISKYGGYDLLVDKSNKLAINMYTKRGFIIYKTVKNQYWMILRNVK